MRNEFCDVFSFKVLRFETPLISLVTVILEVLIIIIRALVRYFLVPPVSVIGTFVVYIFNAFAPR